MGFFNKVLSPDYATGKILMVFRGLIGVLALFLQKPTGTTLRLAKRIFQVIPKYTMLSPIRLGSLTHMIQQIDANHLAGDIVECGSWNGGSFAIMAATSLDSCSKGETRSLWMFDSFEGLPVPSENDGLEAQILYFKGRDKGGQENVRTILARLGVPLDTVRIVPGWFSDTLKTAGVDKIALLHIDADWYESVKQVLDEFYTKVVPGG